MIKEITYQLPNGKIGTLLAREMIVKGSFKNNYISYLKERLKVDNVKILKNKPYTQKSILDLTQGNEKIQKENKMYLEEQKMVMEVGIKTFIKYGEKRNSEKIKN